MKKRERAGPPSRSSGSSVGKGGPSNSSGANVMLLQAITCHAHEYAGVERLVLELVPRCKAFREQLRQTVRPLCAEMKMAGVERGPSVATDAVMDYEVDRFFR